MLHEESLLQIVDANSDNVDVLADLVLHQKRALKWLVNETGNFNEYCPFHQYSIMVHEDCETCTDLTNIQRIKECWLAAAFKATGDL